MQKAGGKWLSLIQEKQWIYNPNKRQHQNLQATRGLEGEQQKEPVENDETEGLKYAEENTEMTKKLKKLMTGD